MSKETRILTVTPTITAGAYTAGDAIGGRLEFARARWLGGGVIESITVIDDALIGAELDIFFFTKQFTQATDNAAFGPSDADMENCVGVVNVPASAYRATTTNYVATVSGIGLPYSCNDATNSASKDTLYAQAVVRGAPTFVGTADLTIKLGVTN